MATEASYKGYAALGEAELVQIKGAEEPVRAHRLLGIATGIAPSGVPRRIGSVGSGRCRPSRGWTVRSMARARPIPRRYVSAAASASILATTFRYHNDFVDPVHVGCREPSARTESGPTKPKPPPLKEIPVCPSCWTQHAGQCW